MHGGNEVVLAQFRPAWDAQLYLRAAKIGHVIENWAHSSATAGGRLPILRVTGGIVPSDEILRKLREIEDLDGRARLSASERAQCSAFESLVRNELNTALEWSRWGNEQHYQLVTKRILLQVLPFPLNYMWNWMERKRMMMWLYLHHNIADEASAKRIAKHAYSALSIQLGQKTWMFGDGRGPTTLDCIVFGHLMDALREPIGSIVFHDFPNLARYCERIQKQFFDNASPEIIRLSIRDGPENMFSKAQGFNAVYSSRNASVKGWSTEDDTEKAGGEEDAQISAKEKEFQEGSRNAILIAGGVVASYLVLSNMVSFQFGGDDYYDDHDDEDDDDDEDDEEDFFDDED